MNFVAFKNDHGEICFVNPEKIDFIEQDSTSHTSIGLPSGILTVSCDIETVIKALTGSEDMRSLTGKEI